MDTTRTTITVGVLTPHAAAGPEVELPLMAPGQVVARVSRITADGPQDGHGPPSSPEGLRALATPTVIDQAASAFRPGSVDALGYASTSSAYALGGEAESRLVRDLRQRWGVPACSTGLAAVAALRSLGVGRVALVHPPWFGDGLNQLGAEYYLSHGLDVVEARLADLPDDPDLIEPAMVVGWIAEHTGDDAEAVVIGGNGFRAVEAIDELEGRLGRPVLESNQVLLWSLLAETGLPTAVRGFGTLFDR